MTRLSKTESRPATRENLLLELVATRSSQSPRFCATRYVTLATAKENRVELLASSAREIPTRVANHGHTGIRVPPSVMNSSTLHLHSARTENCLDHSRHMRLRDCFQSRHEWYSILPTVDDRRVSKVATCFVDYSTN